MCISFPFAQDILINVFLRQVCKHAFGILVPGPCSYLNPEVVDMHVFFLFRTNRYDTIGRSI
jgi:hypothetical protein